MINIQYPLLSKLRVALGAAVILVSVVACPMAGAADSPRERVKENVVKIHTLANASDLFSPWQGIGTEASVGTGVVIEGNRILTNAHLVADQVSVEVRREGTTRLYEATVTLAGHDCDLALLAVEDPAFFEGVEPLAFGPMVALQDAVEVYGFPVGGDSVSITSGIVSRVEVGTYAHSGEHLLLAQVDAALNAGNSGGPIIADGQIVGLAMQRLDSADNVGYIIPTPVIQHFLTDSGNGRFDGFPSLGLNLQKVAAKALRSSLGLTSDETGGLVARINSGGTVDGVLEPGDVLLSIDGVVVAEDLTVNLDQPRSRVDVSWAVRRRQIGETATLRFLRGEERLERKVTLRNVPLLVSGPRFDVKPSYFVVGGLVLQPLTIDYLEALYDWGHNLAYYAFHQYFRTAGRHQVVLLSRVLAAPVNRGYHDWANEVIATIDGKVPRDLAHAVALMSRADGPTIEIRTEEDGLLVLDRKQAVESGPAILERYGIAHDRSADLRGARR